MSASVTGRLDHLNAAIKKLEGDAMQRVCKQVARLGVEAARNAYSSANNLLPGDSAPSVTQTQWDGDGLYVRISGEGAFFIEFGTGVWQQGTKYGLANGFTGGSYSETHGEWLTPPRVEWFHGRWPIPGVKDSIDWNAGQAPADATTAAVDAMREAVAEEFTRIWNGG